MRFAVKESCITCQLCEDIAPSSFRIAEDGTTYEVYRQPATKDEVAACREAMLVCPSDTIVEDPD